MVFEDCAKIIDIACRYDRVVVAAGLEPAWGAPELAARLLAAHAVLPLNLEGLLEACDGHLVAEVGSITTNFDLVAGRYRGDYRPKYMRHV